MRKINLLLTALALLSLFSPSVYAYDAVFNRIDRTGWAAQAPPYSPEDNEDGVRDIAGAKYLIDGNTKTYLSLVKPGKAYGGVSGPAAIEDLYFIVDFPEAQTFNYFHILYREDQNEYLRPHNISIYGSNGTGTDRAWTLIYSASGNEVINLPVGENRGTSFTDEGPIMLQNTAAYTSVKVVYKEPYTTSAGSTLQIGEFYLGNVSYDKVIYKPADISFGEIMQGFSTTKQLNVSGANLDTPVFYSLSGDGASAFTVTSIPGRQSTAGDTATITFTPTEKKIYTATLTINSTNAVEAQTISLTGSAGFDLPVQISSIDATDEHWYYVQFVRQSTNGKALTVVNTMDDDIIKQLPLDTQNPNQQWKVTGTWDNYTLVNKSGYTLYYDYAPASTDPEFGTPIPEKDIYITRIEGSGDTFSFVRYKTTDTWQLKNTSSTVAPSGKFYLNDKAGVEAGGYSLNDVGNQLSFSVADAAGYVIPTDTVKLGATNVNTSKDLTIVIGGVNLTENINVSFVENEDNVFTLNTTTLPAEGDTIKLTYSPVAYKHTSYATISLSSGSTNKTFVIWATSDVGISKYYVSKAQQWGVPTDGETVSEIPTTLKANDIVWIAAGEYEIAKITIPAGVSVYGGFAGTETLPEQRITGSKPWEFTNATILKNKEALIFSMSGKGYVIDGITFEGTSVTGRAIESRGATQGTIRNNILKNFNSAADGGAMNIRSNTEIYNCLITNNTANKGGGAYLDNATIHDCEITNNSVPVDAAKPVGSGNGGGGGLLLGSRDVGGANAYNLYLDGNTASFGGGIFITEGWNLYNSIIVNNTATSGSGVVFDERDSNISIYNVTVADNHSTEAAGAGVCFTADGSDRVQGLYNSIIYNNKDLYDEVYNIGVKQSGIGLAKPEIKSVIIDDLEYYAGEVNPNLIIIDGVKEDNGTKLFVADSYITAEASPGVGKGFTLLKEAVINEEIGVEEQPAVYLEFANDKDYAGGDRIIGAIDIGPYENQTSLSVTAPEFSEGTVIATKYYNIQGVEIITPKTTGVYIKKDLLDNGKVRATKIFINNTNRIVK